MMEFKMSTDLQEALPRSINFNGEELKAELAKRLDHYNHLVITEDSIKEGKADRANLAKLRDAIDKKRKEVKKQWLVPYTKFEGEVKEIIALIDAPIAAIDGQLKAYDELRRDEKKSKIVELYNEMVPDFLTDTIPLERIADPKWLNATVTMKKIGEDLAAIVKRTNADLLVLKTVEPEFRASAQSAYLRHLDIEQAMKHVEHVKNISAMLKQQESEDAPQAAEIAPQATEEPRVEQQPIQTESSQNEKVYRLCLEMHLTAKQATALKEFLNQQQIPYQKI